MQFKTEKISEHITRIHGFCTEFMYLIEGSKAAVLIDTGCGFYSLKNCIHNLTNKPLKVLITHGHVDHAMGANEFEEIYLNHKDKSVYQLHSEKGFRLEGDFEPDRVVFQRRVHAQVMDYLTNGIPERPARFIKALQNYYHTPELTAEQFPWPEALN